MGTEGVGSPNRFPVNVNLERQVLPRHKGEIQRAFKGNAHTVSGFLHNLGDREGLERGLASLLRFQGAKAALWGLRSFIETLEHGMPNGLIQEQK